MCQYSVFDVHRIDSKPVGKILFSDVAMMCFIYLAKNMMCFSCWHFVFLLLAVGFLQDCSSHSYGLHLL